jgi:transcription initiation factor TFIID subunit 6
LIRSETEKQKYVNKDVPTAEGLREPLTVAIGPLLARNLLREEATQQNLAGVVAVIETC